MVVDIVLNCGTVDEPISGVDRLDKVADSVDIVEPTSRHNNNNNNNNNKRHHRHNLNTNVNVNDAVFLAIAIARVYPIHSTNECRLSAMMAADRQTKSFTSTIIICYYYLVVPRYS